MSDKEIVKQAIKKAIKNGWEEGKLWLIDLPEIEETNSWALCAIRQFIIFNPDFAKAFFPPKKECICSARSGRECSCGNYNTGWKYNIQQMVIAPDPILYLKKFL